MNSSIVKRKLTPPTRIHNKVCINNLLNDDCIIQIFKNLSIKDKLMIELVCKRWCVLGKLSWSNSNTFKISDKTFEEMELKNKLALNAKEKKNFILKVIERNCSYLTDLVIKNDWDLNYSLLINEISNYCHNITKLILYCKPSKKEFCEESVLALIFKKNKKLTSIHLENLSLNGTCLASLCAESITELTIKRCSFKFENYLEDLFLKLNNLNKIYIYTSKADLSNKLINSLNESKCENINNFFVDSSTRMLHKMYTNDLKELILRQKKLSRFIAANCLLNENSLKALTSDSLEELVINCNNPRILYPIKNLKKFKCLLINLTDEFLKNLAKCLDLEVIDLTLKHNKLTSEGVTYFSRFENLKTFMYNSDSKNIDDIMISISQCHNITYVDIRDCKFTCDKGLQSIIRNLLNLKFLNISSLSRITKKEFLDIIVNMKYLDKISFQVFEDLDYELLKMASNIKLQRGDANILNIIITIKEEESYYLSKSIESGELELVIISYEFVDFYNKYDLGDDYCSDDTGSSDETSSDESSSEEFFSEVEF